MFKFIEKWALQRLLKRVAEELPIAQDRIGKIWESCKDEILETVKKAIISAVKGFIEKKRQEAKAKIVEFTTNPN